ncbi:hypothetical protein C4566_00720 [Candidatus Parcubacteria bacterium]|nr:MAG: hypothetical protein C4566_00720 [Candidatus Parcubacteria bacterium]
MDNQKDFGQRPMVEGHWECSECGVEITQLPFEPDGDRPIFCRDCYRKKRPPKRDRKF